MLPVSLHDPPAQHVHPLLHPLREYAARMLRFRHMDFEYALWFMVNLCFSPRTAFRSTLYHSRTKHQWARDDPAFLMLLLYLLLISAVSWSLAFAQRTPLQILGLFLHVALVDFLLLGVLLSTVGWWFANTYLRDMQPARMGVPDWSRGGARGESTDSVEWLYAFDVHCNAFVPMYVLLYPAQYILLPLLQRPGFLPAVLSNALYACAFSLYHHRTFLGYSELPFLQRCECFVYPVALILLAFVLSLPLGLNCTTAVSYIYFG
jgi:hypothetical protein